mmetsp:Transcript_17163/g.69048  ORF Transcript_17163/g.69048 Transcript_17163/m.69048 type:complete len:441 (-) Transcript_17163:219-1541(-)
MPAVSRYVATMRGEPATADAWAVHESAHQRELAGEPGLILLSIGDHDFTTDERIVDAAVAALREGRHHYTPCLGLPQLREAIAAYHVKAVGEEDSITAKNVAVTPGAQSALFTAALATLNPGDHVIAFDPMYVTYAGALRARGAVFSQVPLRPEDGFLPREADVRAAVSTTTKAMFVNTPHNPTGVVWPRETLEMLARICIEHDLWLISDEVYYSMTLDSNKEHVSPRTVLPGMADRTIATYSFSKGHAMTGWRLGWVVASEDIISAYYEVMKSKCFGQPPFTQRAALTALGDALDTVATIRDTYRARRDRICAALAKIPHLKVHTPDAGMFLVVDVRGTGIPDAIDFAWRLLEEQKLSLTPGDGFGSMLRGHLRLSYGASDATLDEAARRLAAFVADHPPPPSVNEEPPTKPTTIDGHPPPLQEDLSLPSPTSVVAQHP